MRTGTGSPHLPWIPRPGPARRCPTTTGGPDPPRVVVGVDDSREPRAALHRGLREAAVRRADVAVVGTFALTTSWVPPSVLDGPGSRR
jgi:hypothetical protein